ncbi:uncharacterized protein [Temnothorax nylanderi]|uniref:uncharacterized protein isoform X2 n=1 Tax=Temnothorax nylanderi TaxID=102681 RepID=UPI003A87D317
MWPRWVRRILRIEVQMEDLWVRIRIPRDCLRMDYHIPGFINIDYWRWMREERRINRELQDYQFDSYSLRRLFGEDIEEEEEEYW